MQITEEEVVKAASLWADRNGKSGPMVTGAALETIAGFKQKLSGDALAEALKNLYLQYADGAQD